MSTLTPPDPLEVRQDVARALDEDLGPGDATAALIPEHLHARARVICREAAVIAGRPWFDDCFRRLDPHIAIHWQIEEGASVTPNTLLCRLEGNARALLSGERSALNFLQTLSATATLTRRYVARVRGTGVRILDTRKTLPGLRAAQKYAVRAGGGHNHRLGLYDAILIKENHIAACGSIARAVEQARTHSPRLPIEVEVEDLDELKQALAAGVERILLDNMDLATLRRAVELTARRARLEASGNVTLDNVRAVAETGVDDISIGALTKHVHAVDLSMRLELDSATS